jgi:hypothetical protein
MNARLFGLDQHRVPHGIQLGVCKGRAEQGVVGVKFGVPAIGPVHPARREK